MMWKANLLGSLVVLCLGAAVSLGALGCEGLFYDLEELEENGDEVQECERNEDCAEQYCNDDGECVECISSGDCTGDEVCAEDYSCRARCTGPVDCASEGQICGHDGYCVSALNSTDENYANDESSTNDSESENAATNDEDG